MHAPITVIDTITIAMNNRHGQNVMCEQTFYMCYCCVNTLYLDAHSNSNDHN